MNKLNNIKDFGTCIQFRSFTAKLLGLPGHGIITYTFRFKQWYFDGKELSFKEVSEICEFTEEDQAYIKLKYGI